MYQTEFSSNIEEEPTRVDAGSFGQENSEEEFSVVGAQPENSSYLAGFLDDMSGPELIGLLVGAIILIAALYWFFENIDERLERLGHRLRRWRSKGRRDHRVEFPIARGELELASTGGSASSSLAEHTSFLESERGLNDPFKTDLQRGNQAGELQDAIQNDDSFEPPTTKLENETESLEELAHSLQEQLEATKLELENQVKETQDAKSRILESEDETRQLKEQLADLADQNIDLNTDNSLIDSLKQELDDKANAVSYTHLTLPTKA